MMITLIILRPSPVAPLGRGRADPRSVRWGLPGSALGREKTMIILIIFNLPLSLWGRVPRRGGRGLIRQLRLLAFCQCCTSPVRSVPV